MRERIHGSSPPRFLFAYPRDALQVLAENTGGVVTSEPRQLGKVIERLSRRILLTYQVSRPPDDKARPIEIRSTRPDIVVSAPRWSRSTSGIRSAETRARRVLRDGPETGSLEISGFRFVPDRSDRKHLRGVLQATIGATTPSTKAAGSFRVTVALDLPGGRSFVRHEVIAASQLRRHAFTAPLLAPRETRVVALIVEDLATGEWGSARLSLAPR